MTMLHRIGMVALTLTGLAATPAAMAANVIDQSQETASTFGNYAFGTPTRGWSFTQTFQPAANNLSGVGIRFNLNGLDPTGAPDPDEWFRLSVTRGAQTLSPTAQNYTIDADGWVTSFWTPVEVVQGETYTINFGVFGGSQEPNYSLGVSTTDDYAAGRLTDTFFFVDENDQGQVANNVYSGDGRFDAVFRTYTSSGAVPEPASWALFILGFGLTGAALRRQAAKPAAVV